MTRFLLHPAGAIKELEKRPKLPIVSALGCEPGCENLRRKLQSASCAGSYRLLLKAIGLPQRLVGLSNELMDRRT